MLRDDAWNLILIDHTRAFGPGAELPYKMARIDDEYWARIEALTRGQLDATLRAWLDASEIDAILKRREAMRVAIRLLRK
jgi:predicted methyltransferase MtxX (methanogen marker protein 4)